MPWAGRPGENSFAAYLRREHFGSTLATVETLAGILGFVGVALTATTVFRWFSSAWPGQKEFAIYLYVTYSATVVLFAGWVVVSRKVRNRLKGAIDERGLVARIQHTMSEIVRRRVVRRLKGERLDPLSKDDGLRDLVGGDLRDYLAMKLNRDDFTIVVKTAIASAPPEEGAEAGPQGRLQAAFRKSCGQSKAAQDRKPETSWSDSVVFMKFKESDRRVRRVLIRDTEQLDTAPAAGITVKERNERYKQYAKDSGFRSVLAFPLREPIRSATTGGGDEGKQLEISGICGMFSIDCPDPNAFDPLFDLERRFGFPTNDGRHLKDTRDLDLFFGLADSFATLALVESASVADVGDA